MLTSPFQFLGTWRIEREIDDRLSGVRGHFIGEAVIESKAEDWVYAEQGQLKFARATPMQAERRYIWRPDASGIDIFFEDKRFFHRLELAPSHQAQHWCDPDDYEVTYDLDNWPRWSSVWRVRGPRKVYVMQSAFSPAD